MGGREGGREGGRGGGREEGEMGRREDKSRLVDMEEGNDIQWNPSNPDTGGIAQ